MRRPAPAGRNAAGSRAPRSIGDALRAAAAAAAPETLLAAVQATWTDVAGDRVAAEARPVSEHEGVVTIACGKATWAQELDLLGPTLLERLNAVPAVADRGPVAGLRFTADAARHEDPSG